MRLRFSGKETAERGTGAPPAEDHVQPGADAAPGNGVPEQRVRVPGQAVRAGGRAGPVRNAGEDLVSEPQGQGQAAGENPLRPTDPVRRTNILVAWCPIFRVFRPSPVTLP